MQIIKEIVNLPNNHYSKWYLYSKQKYSELIKYWNNYFNNSHVDMTISQNGKFYDGFNQMVYLKLDDKYALMSGQDMLDFIHENDNEAMYFDRYGNEFIPDKHTNYLVGYDKQEKNAIVYAYQNNNELLLIE